MTFYLPSMTAGVTISTVWAVLFSGDRTGYLNSLLLQLGIIQTPITWLQSPETAHARYDSGSPVVQF